MTWDEIKTLLISFYSQYVGSGNLIDTDSGSPTQIALLVHLVHNRIIHYPINWPFLKVTGTLTLTGATSYDLSVAFPDFLAAYQLYDGAGYRDSDYIPNSEANIMPVQNAYTIKGKILTFTGTPPTSGTLSLQYKSKYMVKDSSGTRKKYFTADDDVTVLDDENVLVWMAGEFVNWNADDTAVQKREEVRNWSKEAFNNLVLANENINQLTTMW